MKGLLAASDRVRQAARGGRSESVTPRNDEARRRAASAADTAKSVSLRP
jgi:hypothetical protein